MITQRTKRQWQHWRETAKETERKPRVFVVDGQLQTGKPKEFDDDVTVLFLAWLDGHIPDTRFEEILCQYAEPIPEVRL